MTQLTLTGELLKQAGLDQVTASNETFVESMRQIARGMSILKGQVCTDDLREAAEKAGLKPSHVNCWGSIFRGPQWVIVGRKYSTYPSTHGREIKIWKWEDGHVRP